MDSMVDRDMLIARTVYFDSRDREKSYDNPFAHRVMQAYNKKFGTEDELGKIDLTFHNNREIKPKIRNSVGGKKVYLIHQFLGYQGEQDPNIGMMALYLANDALKRARANTIIDVIPFQPYQRQDQKKEGRVSISAKTVAKHTELDANLLITYDMHAGQEVGFYEIYVADMEAMPLFVEYLKNKDGIYVPVSPDTGGADRARKMRDKLDPSGKFVTGIAIIDKYRPRDGESEIMYVVGKEHVDGKKAAIIDDMSDTAGTLTKAADALLDAGATEVVANTTHPILSEYEDKDTGTWKKAEDRIMESNLSEVIITDSIPLGEKFFEDYPKFKELSLAPQTAETIHRIQTGGSVSELFQTDL